MDNDQVMSAGNVAVITGAASGIGFAAANKFARLGMKVCLVDVDKDHLINAAQQVKMLCSGREADILALPVDVSNYQEVSGLKDSVYQSFGRVDILMNNAGTSLKTGSWQNYEQWQTILNVNLWGVINGVQAFTESMIEQKTPARIINTGSKQGITCPPGNTAYNISKAGVKALTEGLQHDLRTTDGCLVTAHLLVPGFTYTGMIQSHVPHKPPAAWLPEQVIDYMVSKLNNGDFYIICPDNDVTEEVDRKRILWGAGDLANNRPALSRWHNDFQQAFANYMGEE